MNGRPATPEIDALFSLSCGCVLDGCSGSAPGQSWAAGVRNGRLLCTHPHDHGWQTLVDVVSLNPLEPLPPPPADF